MYIDDYNIKVIGKNYKAKKEKIDTLVETKSTDGIRFKELGHLLDAMEDAHNCGCNISISVEMRQHEYK